MSDLSYDRCPNDDWKSGTAQIGTNPDTGDPVELDLNGVSTVIAIQSAMLSTSAAMKVGHEDDFLAKVALCLFGKLVSDPHMICPLLTVLSMCTLMLSEQAGVIFNSEGRIVIAPPDGKTEAADSCMFEEMEEGEEDDDGLDEDALD